MSVIRPLESTERSVDSLQQIYAVVIALAITQAVASLLRKPDGTLDISGARAGVPAFVAFLFTLVPFWHGMNRHLDRCYLEKRGRIVRGALLFDFALFFIEASILFVAAWLLRSGIESFVSLGALLAVDMLWGVISHLIHFPGEKSHALRWSGINTVAFVLAFLVIMYRFEAKLWVLMVLAIARTLVDYKFGWSFYFPAPSSE